jgi:hypothetical protein
LHEENEVHVLEYREDSNQIDVVAVYDLPARHSLWAIDSSPTDPSLIVTCEQEKDNQNYFINVWKLPGQSKEELEGDQANSSYTGDRQAMNLVGKIKNTDSITNLAWNRKIDDKLLKTSCYSASVWSIEESDIKVSQKTARRLY